MATFAVGDIHGQIGALRTLFREIDFQPRDKIVFLGDYVDRGSNVKGVIDFLLSHPLNDQFIFLMGNHEIMMIAARSGGMHLTLWMMNGGSETLDSYQIDDDPQWFNRIPHDHWKFLESGKSYYQQNNMIFVHAGLEKEVPLAHQNKQHLFWNKYITPSEYHRDKVVICGHTSRKNGLIADFGHTICIDTYAYGGQWLSCLNIDTLEFLQSRENGEIRKGKLLRDQ